MLHFGSVADAIRSNKRLSVKNQYSENVGAPLALRANRVSRGFDGACSSSSVGQTWEEMIAIAN